MKRETSGAVVDFVEEHSSAESDKNEALYVPGYK
jgi:hypothetical protein